MLLRFSLRFCIGEGKRHKEDDFTTGLRYDAKLACSLKLSVALLIHSMGFAFILWSKFLCSLTSFCFFLVVVWLFSNTQLHFFFNVIFSLDSLKNITLFLMWLLVIFRENGP